LPITIHTDEFSYVAIPIADRSNKMIHSTYPTNNKEVISQRNHCRNENLKDADENLWKVYGLVKGGYIIRNNLYALEALRCIAKKIKGENNGTWLNFGYNVPSALCRLNIMRCYIYPMKFFMKKLNCNR